MNILIISSNEKIPVTNYGGTERVVWDLGYELTKMGHKITFLVKSGSYCNFANVIFYDSSKPLINQIPKDTDLIHSHTISDFTDINIPNIYTLHGNTNDANRLKTVNNPVCISKNHAIRNNVNTFVYNGLNWDNYPNFPLDNPKKYFHFLGKATWKVKNLTDAAKIAVKTKNKLCVLGGQKWLYKNLKRGFYWKINPLIEYKGMVNNQEKMEILSQSKGLIFPVKWDEPFGLAIIESLFAGCPVYGSKRGSLPELILDNVGYTSNNIEELIDAVNFKTFNPKECRAYAINEFNSKKMALNYLMLYERVLQGEKLD